MGFTVDIERSGENDSINKRKADFITYIRIVISTSKTVSNERKVPKYVLDDVSKCPTQRK